jgi:hypothetical protein
MLASVVSAMLAGASEVKWAWWAVTIALGS